MSGEELEEKMQQEADNEYDNLVQTLMKSATSFCTVMLANQIEDEEAATRSAEIAAMLYDEVQYQIYRMINPIGGENAESGPIG